MLYKRWLALACSLILIASLLASCAAKEDPPKQKLQNSLEQQKQLKSYQFSGSLEIQLSGLIANGNTTADSKDASMAKNLMNSKLTWTGKEDLQQQRMEMNLNVEPSALGIAIKIPVLLQNHTLHFSIPAINPDGEYWSADITPPDNQKSTTATGPLTTAILSDLVDGLEKDWFVKPDDKQQDGNTTVVLQINDDNFQDILAALREQVPTVLKELTDTGYLTDKQSLSIKGTLNKPGVKDTIRQLKLTEPGQIMFTINKDKYISQIEGSLKFKKNDGASQNIHFVEKISNINQSQQFAQKIPEKTRPFTDILKTLQNQTK